MEHNPSFLRKYWLLLLSTVSFVLIIVLYHGQVNKSEQQVLSEVQEVFFKKEKELHQILREKTELLRKGKVNEVVSSNETFFTHLYKNDSLISWSTNELPIIRYADIHFPSTGLIHLQNGWYYSEFRIVDRYIVAASFLIKRDFAYENKDLKNLYAEDFSIAEGFDLSINPELEGLENAEGNYLFSFSENETSRITRNSSIKLLILLACGLIPLFYWLIRVVFPKWTIPQLISSLVGLMILRTISTGALDLFNPFEFYRPSLYGSNHLFPSFLDYLLNVGVLIYGLKVLGQINKLLEKEKQSKAYQFILLIGFFPFWHFFIWLSKGLVENSNIPLQFDQVFQLNAYSFIALISLGAMFHTYFVILRDIIVSWIKGTESISKSVFLIVFCGFIYFLLVIFGGQGTLFSALFPLLFILLLLFLSQKSTSRNQFTQGLAYLFLFALCLATNLGVYNTKKEQTERQLFAEQLRTDKDPITEIEFTKVIPKIIDDTYLKKFLDADQDLFVSDFIDAIERRLFNEFWERYDMEFFLFAEDGTSCIDNLAYTQEEVEDVINTHGKGIPFSEHVFFIADYIDQYSYLLKVPITGKKGGKGVFYGTFKSKRIPEEIGFPRLLISKNAKVFETLERYSIAKYHEGSLINKYGEYAYPTLFESIKIDKSFRSQYITSNEHSHYVLLRDEGGYLVLSAKEFTWIDLITTFSYLFCFLGVMLLPLFFRKREKTRDLKNLSLAMKIQLVMISLVFFSLLIYGFGSGTFVQNQYNRYTNDVITEKLSSVSLEFSSKFSKDSTLSIETTGNRMEFYLRKFARVFVTDINFYDPNGYLVATSRPRVYNVGLLSEQMNPRALKAMKSENESEFIHLEQIGDLSYSSAYLPYIGLNGKLMGYLNLQHFGQQKDFEVQIQRFLMAIVNVFMFLLATSVIVAILVSGWLTAPLRLIQERFSTVNFGAVNEPIEYDREDEIGSLIKEYNKKIDELALTAQQLAQSERENAWREMAKQVAHEIKNPLTPMKLSLQHFQRIYDQKAPVSNEKINSLVSSLVEQIDGLTRIANEFSSFAKMPNPKVEEVELISLIKPLLALFGEANAVNISFSSNKEAIVMRADKDMILRILNNVVKNSVQATREVESPLIHLVITESAENIEISVQDNGKGISKEEKKNIFVPYFTTKSNGTGLGLAMVKQMVEIHHGNIYFESDTNSGTTFVISFPK
jgi:two-component system nitrogen regulation sensor histidine kinase NtrY